MFYSTKFILLLLTLAQRDFRKNVLFTFLEEKWFSSEAEKVIVIMKYLDELIELSVAPPGPKGL